MTVPEGTCWVFVEAISEDSDELDYAGRSLWSKGCAGSAVVLVGRAVGCLGMEEVPHSEMAGVLESSLAQGMT